MLLSNCNVQSSCLIPIWARLTGLEPRNNYFNLRGERAATRCFTHVALKSAEVYILEQLTIPCTMRTKANITLRQYCFEAPIGELMCVK